MQATWYRMGLALLAFGLAACQPGDAAGTATVVVDGGGTPASATATAAPETAAEATPAPTLDGPPPQTNMAAVEPADRREELTRLTNLLGFQLTGLNGVVLGKITDYVINTCETYIIYMVVEPDVALKVAAGSRVIIPFEAVTINSGIVNAELKTIALYMGSAPVTAAPVVSDPLALYPIVWEEAVRGYWGEVVRVGKLHSACQAGNSTPENAIYKIAYATDLLGAELKDGNGVLLGTVTEGILAPETGKLAFYVVELTDSQGLVLVPLAKTNIPEAALVPGATVELVLLAETGQLTGAPKLDSAEAASSDAAQNSARGYWGN